MMLGVTVKSPTLKNQLYLYEITNFRNLVTKMLHIIKMLLRIVLKPLCNSEWSYFQYTSQNV